jgi:hypothetical protein
MSPSEMRAHIKRAEPRTPRRIRPEHVSHDAAAVPDAQSGNPSGPQFYGGACGGPADRSRFVSRVSSRLSLAASEVEFTDYPEALGRVARHAL